MGICQSKGVPASKDQASDPAKPISKHAPSSDKASLMPKMPELSSTVAARKEKLDPFPWDKHKQPEDIDLPHLGPYKHETEYGTSCTYQGQYKDGKRHGLGTMDFVAGQIYEGTWRNGKRHGYGRYIQQNGSYYVGDWKADMQHGYGEDYNYDCIGYKGEWANHEKHGKGVQTDKDGKETKGVWSKGKLIAFE